MLSSSGDKNLSKRGRPRKKNNKSLLRKKRKKKKINEKIIFRIS